MRNAINILKIILVCAIGMFLLFMPYEKFQSIFPAAKSKILVKVAGGFVLLCGLFVAFIMMSEF
ncbi:hypothetical protein [Clostridium sp. Marseille-P2415]|uniref:hypothetical protein n=1 Tax=Clostridium sp. Marseille-P2415 TaxID=1805471 RepID=UPI0009884DFF|nr:hypothetical protein [Clostridium sp. Marseille-P2415]